MGGRIRRWKWLLWFDTNLTQNGGKTRTCDGELVKKFGFGDKLGV